MRLAKQILWITLLIMGITACSYTNKRYQTPSAEPILPSLTPSEDHQATQTPTIDPYHGFSPGSTILVALGNYLFKMPANPIPDGLPYVVDQQGAQVSIASVDEGLMFSMISEWQVFDTTAGDCITLVVNRMSQEVEGFQAQDADPVMLGEVDGFASKIRGVLFEQPFSGVVTAGLIHEGRCFSMIGISLGEDAENRWQNEGAMVFEAILESLEFTVSDAVGECETSRDATYGYSPDNPIRVGNRRLYDGLVREQAYLGVLVTKEGEAVSFERSGSMINDAGDILDVYVFTIPGQTEEIEIYLDFYTYETLRAPLNLSCNVPFPIEAP